MHLRFRQSTFPLLAIFCALCLLTFRLYQIVDQNLNCKNIPQPDIHEICSSYSVEQNPISPAFPSHPFEDGPKFVIILTYQRCGSTFFGEIFNENPDAFYMFEPLDSLYSAMYGTIQGWNVPSDITSYKNGSQRILPPEEIKMVSQMLFNLLTCNVNALPTESFVHRFFTQYSLEFLTTNKYIQCVMKLMVRASECNALIPSSYCGSRFGNKSEEVLVDCRRAMTDETYRGNHPNSSIFDRYIGCMNNLRELLDDKCSSLWQTSCSNRTLRAVKLVRGTMDSMAPLLRALPNLRIIHLIRDPRAVVLSRHGFDASVLGMFSGLDQNLTMFREAYLYCRTVVTDVRRRRELEATYPGKVITVIYDDVVRDVKGYIRNVYKFLDMSVPEDVLCWYRKNKYPKHYGERLNSSAIANRWHDLITIRQNKQIVAACKEFFDVVKYTWTNLRV